MSELVASRRLANRVLDRPGEDPDSDLSVLGRQLLRSDEVLISVGNLLCNVGQILDVVKSEWAESWSAWDQEQRDAITALSKMIYERKSALEAKQ